MLTIIVYGCDGSEWHVHGEDQGAEGVWLGKGQVKGLFEAPVRTAWKSASRQSGGTYKGHWNEWRDVELGFHVAPAPGTDEYEDVHGRLRDAFDFELDRWDHDAVLARIEVQSSSDIRCLDVQLYEHPDFNPETDPTIEEYGNIIMPVRAGQPLWYGTPKVTSWSTTSTSGSGLIAIENPTDQPMRHKWVVTRGEWTLPDISWQGPRYKRVPGVSKMTGRDDSARSIMLPPITAVEGGATVDLDPMKLMIRDAADTNLLGRMPVPGMRFEYAVPPRTPKTMLPVSVANAPAGGAMVQCIQPRLWSSPIGS